MPIYIEGVLKLVQVSNIKGLDSTKDFTYYTNFIQYTDKEGLEKVLEINSKEDFRPHRDKKAVFTLSAYKTRAEIISGQSAGKEATLYKLSLSAVDEVPRSGRDKDNG